MICDLNDKNKLGLILIATQVAQAHKTSVLIRTVVLRLRDIRKKNCFYSKA